MIWVMDSILWQCFSELLQLGSICCPMQWGQIGGNWSPHWLNKSGRALLSDSAYYTHTHLTVDFRHSGRLATFLESIGVAWKTNGAWWGVCEPEGEWGKEPRLGVPSFVSKRAVVAHNCFIPRSEELYTAVLCLLSEYNNHWVVIHNLWWLPWHDVPRKKESLFWSARTF